MAPSAACDRMTTCNSRLTCEPMGDRAGDSEGNAPVVMRAGGKREGFLLLPLCGLGDAVLFLPALDALRARYPDAQILVIVANDQAKEIVEAATVRVDAIVFNRAIDGGLLSVLRLLRLLRKRRFRVVISGAHYESVRVPMLALLTGCDVRVGAKSERLSWAYNCCVDVEEKGHSARRYLQLLKGIGVAASGEPRVVLTPPRGSEASATGLWHELGLADATAVVGLASGADINERGRWRPWLKRWNVEGYARVAQWLVKTANVRVVAFGTADEAVWAERLSVLSGVPIPSLCGRTSVGEMLWLLKRCTALLCNDTGTMHMAAAVGTPVVALFGPTDPAVFGPRGPKNEVIEGEAPCAPCYPNPTCDLAGCSAMDAIAAEEVIRRVSRLL